MLLVGTVLVLAAFGVLYVGMFGLPSGRVVSRERIAAYSRTEHTPTLTKIANGVVAGVEKVMSRRGWRPFTTEELELAGVRSSMASVVVVTTCLGFAVAVVVEVLVGSILLALLAAAVAPVGAKLLIGWRASRRRRAFQNQLAPLLQLLASSLRAGHSLPRAMDASAVEAESPMKEELSRVVNEYRLGRDLVDAMEQVADRMQSEDFRWIAGAIEAQRETGGNLNEILDQVAETIRERNHIRLQVMALSAEGRISALILMALPVGIGIYYTLINPETMGIFVGTLIGKLLLVGSGVMYALGGLWMRSIVRIDF